MDLCAESSPSIIAKPHCYEFFGLSFRTAEPIPGLAESQVRDPARPIEIQFGSVPVAIAKPTYEDDSVQASSSEYLFLYPGLLRIYVEGDRRIVVERLEGCDPVRLWTIIFGLGSSIVGFRRGLIPLHASAIRVGEACVALAGQTGSGKSTLAASLTDLGFTLHADDLCLLQPASAGLTMVPGGIRELRLWDDAIATLGWDASTRFARMPDISKSVYRLPEATASPLPLKRIYALEFSNETKAPGIFRIAGVDGLQTLIWCLRLRSGLLTVGARQRTFETLARISRDVEMFRFVRPLDPSQLRAWSERLASHMAA